MSGELRRLLAAGVLLIPCGGGGALAQAFDPPVRGTADGSALYAQRFYAGPLYARQFYRAARHAPRRVGQASLRRSISPPSMRPAQTRRARAMARPLRRRTEALRLIRRSRQAARASQSRNTASTPGAFLVSPKAPTPTSPGANRFTISPTGASRAPMPATGRSPPISARPTRPMRARICRRLRRRRGGAERSARLAGRRRQFD